jgi:uncharacterized protein YkwD
MRKLVLGLILALGVMPFLAADAKADTVSDEAAFVTKINALRAGKGLAPLTVNANLTAKARTWSAGMAAAGKIWHSTLSDGVTEDWRKLGENVGMGGSVDGLHTAFVNSPHHYDNLVDPAFGYVGIGIVMNGNTIYVTEVFMQLMPVKTPVVSLPILTPTTSAPATTTTTKPKAVVAASTKPAAPKATTTTTARPAPPTTTTTMAQPTTTTTTTQPPAPPVEEVRHARDGFHRTPSPLLVSVLERLRSFNS